MRVRFASAVAKFDARSQHVAKAREGGFTAGGMTPV